MSETKPIQILFSLILLAIILQSCHRKDPDFHYENYPYNYTGSNYSDYLLCYDVLDYMIFQPGSYWILEKDSLNVDTLTVDSLYFDTIEFMINRRTFYEEEAKVFYNSSYYNFNYYDAMKGSDEYVERIRVDADSTEMTDVIFMNPPDGNPYLDFVKYPYYEIDGYEYSNVIKVIAYNQSHIYTSDSTSTDYVTMYFYFAKNIGLIKRSNIDDDEIWLIKEYDVSQ